MNYLFLTRLPAAPSDLLESTEEYEQNVTCPTTDEDDDDEVGFMFFYFL